MTTTDRAPLQIAVDAWSPEMGTGGGSPEPLGRAAGSVDPDVELGSADWAPRSPTLDAVTGEVAFIDGVRRIEGNLWLSRPGERTRQAIAASIGAGIVRCTATAATITTCEVQRLLLGPAGVIDHLDTDAGRFVARPVADDDPDTLRAGVQERLRRLERRVLEDAADADLVVVDGPLDAALNVERAVGYVKSHHVGYLDAPVSDTVAALRAGQRTPLFLITSSWTRYAWCLRLPYGGDAHPWAGVVRCEASADLPRAEVVALADRVTVTLPRFASQPHTDRRAPQNLHPIGGLERELTHRLGDAALVLRGLRAATARPQRRDTDTDTDTNTVSGAAPGAGATA